MNNIQSEKGKSAAPQRRPPIELSRTRTGDRTIQARYKAGYGVVVVNSRFTGKAPLGDLLFDVIRRQREASLAERENR